MSTRIRTHLGTPLLDSLASDWQVLGNTAQRLVDAASGLVEHYEAGSGGVEVTWILNHVPPAAREIKLVVELEGVQFSQQTASGLHFADPNGLARVKVGAALAMDQRGRSWPIPMQATGDSLSLSVPAFVIAQAEFPLAIDPVLSAEFGLDQPVDVSALCTRSAPVLAANDSFYLVVWTHGKSDATAPGVYGARVDFAGNLLDHYGVLISPLAAEQTVCSVAANPGGFLVVWSALHTNSVIDWDILAARVLPDGQVLDRSPLPICTLVTTVQNSPAVAANGDNFLVTWRDSRNTGIYGTLVQPDGRIAPTNGFSVCNAANEQFTPAVAALGTNYLVAWQDYRSASSAQFHSDIYGTRVTGAGVVLNPTGIAICTRTNSQFHPAIAANGTHYLVVWEDFDRGGNDICGARLSSDGILLDTNPIVISHSPNLQANPATVGVGADFLVVWQDFRLTSTNTFAARTTGARVRDDGSVVDPDGVAFSADPGPQWYPAVAAQREHLMAVWQDGRDNPLSSLTDIFGASVSTNLEAASNFRVSGAANPQFVPAVAGNGAQYLVVWSDLRSPSSSGLDIYGVRIAPDGALLDPAALPLCTATNTQADPAVAVRGTNYLVAWSDFRATPTNASHGDIYACFVGSQGSAQPLGGLPICTVTNDQSLPAVTGLGTNFLVVWQDARATPSGVLRYDIYGARVTALGSVLDPLGIPICTNTVSQTNPAVAANFDQALVVWADARNVGVNTDIYGARVDTGGAVLDPNGLAISTASFAQSVPAVAANGQGYCVVWADGRNGALNAPDIYGTFVTLEGAVQPTAGFPIALGVGQQTAPALSFNGLDYLVAWQGARESLSNSVAIYATGVSPQGGGFGALVLPIATNAINQVAPAVGFSADGRFLVLDQGTLFSASRILGRVVDLEALPRLEPVAPQADGPFQFRLRGAPGYSYALESSDDLKTWNPMATFLCTNFSTSWTDPTSTQQPRRFYRARLLP